MPTQNNPIESLRPHVLNPRNSYRVAPSPHRALTSNRLTERDGVDPRCRRSATPIPVALGSACNRRPVSGPYPRFRTCPYSPAPTANLLASTPACITPTSNRSTKSSLCPQVFTVTPDTNTLSMITPCPPTNLRRHAIEVANPTDAGFANVRQPAIAE